MLTTTSGNEAAAATGISSAGAENGPAPQTAKSLAFFHRKGFLRPARRLNQALHFAVRLEAMFDDGAGTLRGEISTISMARLSIQLWPQAAQLMAMPSPDRRWSGKL